MDTETVAVTEQLQVPEVVQENAQEAPVNETEVFDNAEVKEEVEERNVPLSALQKERKKRQEAEQRNLEKDQELIMFREHQLKQMQQPVTQEEDDTLYEPVTKAEFAKQLKAQEKQTLRAVSESTWISENPEKAEVINEKLANFLKKRPNLAAAIEGAPNRYEQAWEFLDILTPKQKAVLNSPTAIKREAPNSPSGVPKAAAMNQAVDVMSMSESEFAAYRKSKRSRR